MDEIEAFGFLSILVFFIFYIFSILSKVNEFIIGV